MEESKQVMVKQQAAVDRVPEFVKKQMQTLEGAKEYAAMVLESGLAPKHFYELDDRSKPILSKGKVGMAVITMQHGHSLGLNPLQSFQDIVPINNMITIKGDGAKALIMASGLCSVWEEYEEGKISDGDYKYTIKSQRKDNGSTMTRSFSVYEAKRAGLWVGDNADKSRKYSPWFKYPKRMIMYRALGFLVRDLYSDVLKGTVTYEEAIDYPKEETPTQVIGEDGNPIEMQVIEPARVDEDIPEKKEEPVDEDSSAPDTEVPSGGYPEEPSEEEPVFDNPEGEANSSQEDIQSEYTDQGEEEQPTQDDGPGIPKWNSEWRVYTYKELFNMPATKLMEPIMQERDLVKHIPSGKKNTNKLFRNIILDHQEKCGYKDPNRPDETSKPKEKTKPKVERKPKKDEKYPEKSENKTVDVKSLDLEHAEINLVVDGIMDIESGNNRDVQEMITLFRRIEEFGVDKNNFAEISSKCMLDEKYAKIDDLVSKGSLSDIRTILATKRENG